MISKAFIALLTIIMLASFTAGLWWPQESVSKTAEYETQTTLRSIADTQIASATITQLMCYEKAYEVWLKYHEDHEVVFCWNKGHAWAEVDGQAYGGSYAGARASTSDVDKWRWAMEKWDAGILIAVDSANNWIASDGEIYP